jgi:hypothetical protein
MGTVIDLGGARRHRPPRRLIGAPRPGTEDFRLWVEWIGRRLTERDLSGLDAVLEGFAELARDAGVEPGAVADDQAPHLARARAFFKVAMLLADPERPGPTAA